MKKVKLEGNVNLEDLMAAVEIRGHRFEKPGLRWLVDLENAVLHVSGSEARQLAAVAQRAREAGCPCNCQVHLLADRDVTYGTLRMIQVYLEGLVDLKLYRSREELPAIAPTRLCA